MSRPNSIVAGIGAIAFAVLTFAAIFFVNWPGGGYSESISKSYVAPGNLPIALTGTLIGLIGVVGLICLLAYLRQAAEESLPAITLLPQVVWAVGLMGAASFGVGWGLVSAQPLAHVEAPHQGRTLSELLTGRWTFAGAQPGHTFPETGGHSGSPGDTEAAEFEFRRTVADPGGHARTRHRDGSGP